MSLIGTDLSAWLTGQLIFAVSAAAWNPAASRFGTSPLTVNRISVIPVPGTKSTSAEVRSWIGGVPDFANPFERAIEKHAACAAPSNSSGLVCPFGSWLRAGQEILKVPTPDDCKETVPFPSSKFPFQTAEDFLVVVIAVLSLYVKFVQTICVWASCHNATLPLLVENSTKRGRVMA